jgi:hypothetical protein
MGCKNKEADLIDKKMNAFFSDLGLIFNNKIHYESA